MTVATLLLTQGGDGFDVEAKSSGLGCRDVDQDFIIVSPEFPSVHQYWLGIFPISTRLSYVESGREGEEHPER